MPFSIRDEAGQLLLARGHVVDSDASLAALQERGATVDVEEVQQRRGEAVAPPAENFPARWHQLTVRASVVLRPPLADDFLDRLQEIRGQILGMSERDPDMLLYLALRTARDPGVHYGVLHALHVATVCALLSRRLHWTEDARLSLVSAALTMNMSMVELQSRLAGSTQPPTQAQREVIDRHAADSVALLRKAGVDDEAWLQTVEQHHPAAAGTPDEPGEAARLLRLVDAYTTRITDRPDTIIASPALAARDLFAQHRGDPFALLLVKELGMYPPGCFVRIASGETAVVLRRGQNANAPLVACVTNKRGDALQQPTRRDTGLLPEHAVTQVVPDKDVRVRMPSQQLYA
ncbi:HD-GYP domain-containing protein [Ideonella sp. BN130291]|uniref:HD-GYP domain-containing protein n=1 Tax=Ideonella sp. BN130291 TaxID=3112940 RepID=UPI002E2540AE|nr:phosphohydrolase [Ideonella sp. BN130291]